MIGNWPGLALKVAEQQTDYLCALQAEKDGKLADVGGACAAYRQALEQMIDAAQNELDALPLTPGSPEPEGWVVDQTEKGKGW